MKLTKHEIMMIASLVAALLLGAVVKHYRAAHPPADPASMGIRGR